MLFCVNCGKQLPDDAKYCFACGKSVVTQADVESIQRKVEFGGTVYKCPYCGENLPAFTSVCPSCKNELRGTSSSESVNDLLLKIQGSTSDSEKIQLIRFFPIPNSKEDILEFMILAVSNFDAEYYVSHLDEKDISDAWLAKIEQSYQKANISLPQGNELNKINELYKGVNEQVQKIQKKKITPRYRAIGTMQIVIASFLLWTVVYGGSGFVANPRLVFTGLMMITSGILTYFYIKIEELKKYVLASYWANMLLNFCFTFRAKGHLLFFILYIVIILVFLFGTKRSNEKSKT